MDGLLRSEFRRRAGEVKSGRERSARLHHSLWTSLDPQSRSCLWNFSIASSSLFFRSSFRDMQLSPRMRSNRASLAGGMAEKPPGPEGEWEEGEGAEVEAWMVCEVGGNTIVLASLLYRSGKIRSRIQYELYHRYVAYRFSSRGFKHRSGGAQESCVEICRRSDSPQGGQGAP
jgi:hypothetical protein